MKWVTPIALLVMGVSTVVLAMQFGWGFYKAAFVTAAVALTFCLMIIAVTFLFAPKKERTHLLRLFLDTMKEDLRQMAEPLNKK